MTLINLGTAPSGSDGDTVRKAFNTINTLLVYAGSGIPQQVAITDNSWDFGNASIFICSETIFLTGVSPAGEMAMIFHGLQRNSDDVRMALDLRCLALTGIVVDSHGNLGAIEQTIVGDGDEAPNYTRLEWGWQEAGPGWYGWHQESVGFGCRPQTLGMSDHTAQQGCLHFIGGTNGPIVAATPNTPVVPMSGARTFAAGAIFWGLLRQTGNEAIFDRDGVDIGYLQPCVPAVSGFHNSHSWVWSGTWNAGGGSTDYHVVDWRWVVSVTDTSGTNTYKLQCQKNLTGGYVDHLVIDEKCVYLPTTNGTPGFTPQSLSGFAAMMVDPTNNKFWFYNGAAWKSVTLT